MSVKSRAPSAGKRPKRKPGSEARSRKAARGAGSRAASRVSRVVPTEHHHKIWKKLELTVDVRELGEHLTELHQDMKDRATLPEHHVAAEAVGQAAQAARAGQGPEAVAWLGKSASHFATSVAEETGKELCADVLKTLLLGMLL